MQCLTNLAINPGLSVKDNGKQATDFKNRNIRFQFLKRLLWLLFFLFWLLSENGLDMTENGCGRTFKRLSIVQERDDGGLH